MAKRKIKKKDFARYPRPLQGGVRVLSGRGGNNYGGGLGGGYQRALDEANAANERRYQEILGGYDALHGRVMGDLAGVGQQQTADINRSYRNAGSRTNNQLVQRGFGNSSLISTMQQGNMRERSEAQRRLQEGLLQQRAGYDTRISQGKLGVMERRTDLGPDPNQMIKLMQGMGRGGVGMGGVGGIGYNAQNAYRQGMMNHFNPLGMGIQMGPARGYGGRNRKRRRRPSNRRQPFANTPRGNVSGIGINPYGNQFAGYA